MAYGEGQTAQVATPPTSLVSDSGHIVERLQTLHNHLIDLGCKLHGSKPRDALASGQGTIEPEPTLRRNLEKAGSWLGDIETELTSIIARL